MASAVTAIRMSRPRMASLTNSLTPCPAQQTLLQDLDQQHAQQRADHRAGPAEDVDAADHDRGDDLQLQPLRGGDGDVAEADQEHEPGQTGERAADRRTR